MKKLIYSFLLFFATSAMFSQTPNAEITYIGNEGFMISNNDKKIFIDALYYYTYGAGIMNVDQSLRTMIMNDSGPFANSSLFLITHSHPDHWDKNMMVTYLTKNTQSKLVGPTEVTSEMSNFGNKEQVVGLHPNKKESIDTTVNGINLTVFNLLHDVGYRIYNVGYLADLDGFKVFHSGDNTLEDTTEFTEFKLQEKNIDVAFLNYNNFWKTEAQRSFVKRYIKPKYIVLMHIPVGQPAIIKENVKSVAPNFYPLIVLSTSMEKVVIKDTISYVNLMPASNGKISDTTLYVNTPVQITLPKFFTDPDQNDSVSYSMKSLPDGLSFDSKTLVISGTPTKVMKKKVSYLGTDKSLAANEYNFTINVVLKDKIESVKNAVDFYPNPCINELTINNIPTNAKVKLYSIQGMVIKEADAITRQMKMNVSDLKKGIYFISVETADRKLSSVLEKE